MERIAIRDVPINELSANLRIGLPNRVALRQLTPEPQCPPTY